MNKKKAAGQNRLFRFILILLPVLLLLFLEIFLRFLPGLQRPPLFLRDDSLPGKIVVNSQIAERYFNPNKVPLPNLYPAKFSSEPSDSALRIVCMGGSSTAGFPYEMNVPFPAQLQYLLDETVEERKVEVLNLGIMGGSSTAGFPYEMNVPFPAQLQYLLDETVEERKVEVLNLGISAVSSFVLLDMIDEVLALQPDLIVIYAGHNEIYGVFGTASTAVPALQASLTRMSFMLDRSALFRSLRTLVRSMGTEGSDGPEKTLMEVMFAGRQLAPGSRNVEQAGRNLYVNLSRIAQKCEKEAVPLMVSELVSNIADQPPLHRQSGSSADSLFLLGQAFAAENSFSEAYELLNQAKDMDAVPFRAPSSINHSIQKLADDFSLPLVRMDSAFRTASPGQLPGRSLFCDHLHPLPEGYHLMAHRILQTMIEHDVCGLADRTLPEMNPPRFISELDRRIGDLRLQPLLMTGLIGNQEHELQPDSGRGPAGPVLDSIALSYLTDHHIWGRAHSDLSNYYIESKDAENAVREMEILLRVYPDNNSVLQPLLTFYENKGDPERLIRLADHALKYGLGNRGELYYRQALAFMQDLRLREAYTAVGRSLRASDLSPGQELHSALFLSELLIQMNEPGKATLMLEEIQKNHPDHRYAAELLRRIKTNERPR